MNNLHNITVPLPGAEAERRNGGVEILPRAPTLPDRLRAEWKLKLLLTVVLNVWVYGPYRFLQHHHFFPAYTMPETFCDRLIPFSDLVVWLYLSIYLLMPIGPFLMNRRRQILRYALGIALIGVTADLVFLFWPTCCPRPVGAGTNATYRMLVGIDNPFHAFPSLHAAFAVYSASCGALVLREMRGHSGWSPVLWFWTLLILFGTLATKQHMVWDIIAGSLLGLAAYFVVFGFRRSPAETSARLALASQFPNATNTTPS